MPSASEHKYACTAGTGDVRPWVSEGDEPGKIGDYAHARGPLWQEAARTWNIRDSDVPPLPLLPIGVIKDYTDPDEARRTLDLNATVVESDRYGSVWPVAAATAANATRANLWGLHDMIGNAWEWCHDSNDKTEAVICGGSCVSPPKHILLEFESDYTVSVKEFAGTSVPRGNDIGFRVIVPAK